MNLSLQHARSAAGADIRRINLLGHLERPEETAELAALLVAPDLQPIEIVCFDADTLPAEIIQAIAAALDRGLDVKVRAYRPLLAFSLLRLSLPVLPVPPQAPQALLANCRAVALAGSANSLDKILAIVEHLPMSEASIFIAQHVMEDRENLLDRLLKARTEYSVVMPQQLMKVQPRTIYVAPPGFHMRVAHGLVYLTHDRMISYARPSIDVLFESLAAEYGPSTLVALLCGFGQDGVAGCAAVRAVGGCVLVENGSECEGAGVLPDSAFTAGHFDHQLRQRGIASIVAAAVSPRRRTAEGPLLDLFLEAVHEQTGYDFCSYQRGTLERRINNLISQAGFASFFDCQRAALSNPQMTQRLLTELSINVTEFFRHPEQFRLLREQVLPYLASFPLIKVWSAGCATGEEAYSLAMLLDELGLLEKSRIFATDINPTLLELARAGLYPREVLQKSRDNHQIACGCTKLPQRLLDCGRYLKVAERYRERVLFHHHSLGQDGGFNEFQLIVCRNVMIYFDPDLQRRVFSLFAQSLHREGFLLLGPSDGLKTQARECHFKPDLAGDHLYRFAGNLP
jgi:chemotaxis protein methyltransferase CheR